eukprot:CAMPEP_0202703638 /NCGR_PEP_ID=MMETSP1385-20130828/16460_1 /ASSEMBLY_ACC=CAM_ASM_000861 /TAXON_ID=933848 /ORGANISM="Elphidium margaritaceum" /LENGTH=99 /DNA_ID=CAMNT_0049361523 /DNA_START=31 /DNA_END=330 /DNA_ORIENTATION=-
MSSTEQLEGIQRQLRDLKNLMQSMANQNEELRKRVQFLEERLDNSTNPLDMARSFELPEIKTYFIKATIQGISFYSAYLLLGFVWERFLTVNDKPKTQK